MPRLARTVRSNFVPGLMKRQGRDAGSMYNARLLGSAQRLFVACN